MFCTNCGKELRDGMKFCEYCGAKQEIPEAQQPVYQAPPQSQQYEQPVQNGQPDFQQQSSQQVYFPPVENPVQPELSMKWYKFTIYFALFAGSLMNIISAIMNLTGASYTMYDLDPEIVYGFYDGLQVLDICYALMLIALAFFGLYARQNLAKFKKNGPMLKYALSIASTVISTVYSIGSSIIIGDELSTVIGSVVGSIIGTVVVLYCEIKYFTKRQHLFAN